MRLVQIRASRKEELDCLARELAAYRPSRSRRFLLVEVEEGSQTQLLELLSAIEACINDNDIRSVRLTIDGERYMLAAQ